jgi:hypothetical protein
MRKFVFVGAIVVSAIAAMGTLGARKAWATETRPNAYVTMYGHCDYCTSPIGSFCNCQILPPVIIKY